MEQHDGDESLPSSHSVQRYADGVHTQVGDLRATLRAALDEAEQHEAAGRPDLAVAALERQRAALAQVHARLEHLTASAAVEREAEDVLWAAASRPSGGGSPVPASSRGSTRRRRVAVTTAAFVTAATGAAVALTGGLQPPPSGPSPVAVAPVEVESAPPPSAAPTDGADGTGPGSPAVGGQAPGGDAPVTATGRAPEVDGAAPGDGATPRGRLDVLVQQVVETLGSLLGDAPGDDADGVSDERGDGVGEPTPTADRLQDVAPSAPATEPAGAPTGDDAPAGRDASDAAGADGTDTGVDGLP